MASIPSGSPSVAPKHFYQGAVDEVAVQVSGEKANLYGFEVENNGASDVYLQVFDKLAVDVTVGTTTPDYTFRIPASSNFGKDSQQFPLHYHGTGVTIAVTATRTGSGAPASDATVQMWFSKGI